MGFSIMFFIHIIGLQECVIIYQFIQRIPLFIQNFENCVHDQKELLDNEFKTKFETLQKVWISYHWS